MKIKRQARHKDGRAEERVALKRLLDKALEFYEDPDNLQAFKAWQKNKEDFNYAANHNNV